MFEEDKINITDDRMSVFTFSNTSVADSNIPEQVQQFRMNYLLIDGTNLCKLWEHCILAKLHKCGSVAMHPFKLLDESEIMDDLESSIEAPKTLNPWI